MKFWYTGIALNSEIPSDWNFKYSNMLEFLYEITICHNFQNSNTLEFPKFEDIRISKSPMSEFPLEIPIYYNFENPDTLDFCGKIPMCQNSIEIPYIFEFPSEIPICQNFWCQKFQYLRVSGVRNSHTLEYPKLQYIWNSDSSN